MNKNDQATGGKNTEKGKGVEVVEEEKLRGNVTRRSVGKY